MAFDSIKEFIKTGDGSAGTLLIPKLILPPLIEAVEKALVPRELAAMVKTGFEGSSFSVNLVTPTTNAVRIVAEGAEIPIDTVDFTSITFTPKKYGIALRISREMMEDSQFDILSVNLNEIGRRFAENETNLILTALEGAGNTVTGGASLTIANLSSAILNLNNNDYNASDLLIGNEILSDLQNIDTFVEADKAGNTQVMSTGFIGNIFGMRVAKFSTNAAPTTTYAKYAYVLDRTQAYGIAIKRDITVENFTLPLNDLEGAAVTQRLDVKLLRANAVCNITTT